jgi:hypothetical protein
MAAARLHRNLGLRDEIEARGGNVDVFGAIQTLDLPLLLRPLQGLLGAYLSEPAPGVRERSKVRFRLAPPNILMT